MTPKIHGGYTRGCYAGGERLEPNGPAWQAMRLHRNRNWGHPRMVAYVRKLATDAKAAGDWNGLLVGDLSQPRGGPMLSGHRSHQLGIDADIWLREMPEERFTLTQQTQAKISAISVIGSKMGLGQNKYETDPKIWREGHYKLIKRAASYAEVQRIFLHPAIKKQLCATAPEDDRSWLRKIRPWWGHHYHMHVRLGCPPGNPGCKGQKAVGAGDGCGKPVEGWLKTMRNAMRPRKPVKKTAKPKKRWRPRKAMTLARMPAACKKVLLSDKGEAQVSVLISAKVDEIARWKVPPTEPTRNPVRPLVTMTASAITISSPTPEAVEAAKKKPVDQ